MAQEHNQQSLEAIKIDDNAYRIEDGQVRSFLFIGSEKALLIDTGFGKSGSMRAMVRSLTDKEIVVANTHTDDDHVGCNQEFEAVWMHPSEMSFYFIKAPKEAKVNALWDGDTIDIGGRSFEVVLIPGHTPGSIAFLDRENRILVSGDSVSAVPVFMFGKARNIQAYMISMEKLLGMTTAIDTIYTSHGEFPMPVSRINQQLVAARKLYNNELEAQEPPFQLPAKMYIHDGAGFFY